MVEQMANAGMDLEEGIETYTRVEPVKEMKDEIGQFRSLVVALALQNCSGYLLHQNGLGAPVMIDPIC